MTYNYIRFVFSTLAFLSLQVPSSFAQQVASAPTVYEWGAGSQSVDYFDLIPARKEQSYDILARILVDSVFLGHSLGMSQIGVISPIVKNHTAIDCVYVVAASECLELYASSTKGNDRGDGRFVLGFRISGKSSGVESLLPIDFKIFGKDSLGNFKNVSYHFGYFHIASHNKLSDRDISGAKNIQKPVTDLQMNPNPFTGSSFVSFQSKGTEPLTIKVYDILGSEVYSGLIKPLRGANTVPFDPKLPRGLYIYSISSSGFSETRRFVIY